MHLQVGRLGTAFHYSPVEVALAREAFDRAHCLQLPNFLEPALLAAVQGRLREAAPSTLEHEGIGDELRLAFGTSTAALDLTMNDHVLFDALRLITGVWPIGYFAGRVYELTSSARGFNWHDDNSDDRVLALSLNLGAHPYQGGLLQIAEVTTGNHVCEVANVVAGDAVVVRIGPQVMHRVTPVDGPTSKVAYAGWFRSQPSYQELMREHWHQSTGG